MINSLVIRNGGKHITAADYGDVKPLLSLENVKLSKYKSLEGRAFRRLLPIGVKLSHREFDIDTRSYRLGVFMDELRKKGWTIINHDAVAPTNDVVPRIAKYTRYEIYAEISPELALKLKEFCKAVDEFEAKAAARCVNNKAVLV